MIKKDRERERYTQQIFILVHSNSKATSNCSVPLG